MYYMDLSLKLSRRDLKMALLKQAINYISPRLFGSLEVKSPQTFQGQILSRAFDRIEKRLKLEDELDLRGDSNFPNMVKTTKRALLFLAETDNFYARWLGLLLQELAREVNDFEARFSYEDALKAGGRPIPLKREVYEAHRKELLNLALSGYLTRLDELTQDEKAELKGGWYRLRFTERGGP
jgi:hypothetical protein